MKKSALKRNFPARKRFRRNGPARLNLGVAALFFLFGLILFGKLAGFIGDLSKPLSADEAHPKKFSWDGTSTFNLAVKSDKIYIVSFNPQEHSLTSLRVPDEIYVNVPLGFGSWPMRSVYDLGQAEKLPIGPKLFKETAGSVFGLPVDGYVITSGDFEESIKEIRGNPAETLRFIRESQTDLSLGEMLRFVWGVRGVRFDRIGVTDLERSDLTSWVLLPDGSRGLSFDRPELDQFIQDRFQDSRLRDLGFTIGIYNTTEHSGLAERAARVIANLGGRVVFTANSGGKLTESKVLGKDSYTKKRLLQIFAPSCLRQESWIGNLLRKELACAAEESDSDSRADINIYLGEDYFLQF